MASAHRWQTDKKIYEQTQSTDRAKGRGRPRKATTDEIADEAFEFMQSQEREDGEPGTHLSLRKTARVLHIGKSSVQRISKKTIAMPLNNYKRMITLLFM